MTDDDAERWPVPEAVRRIQLAPNETLAVLYHEPIDPDHGQTIAEQLAAILGVDSWRVVVLSGADDLVVVSNDEESAK